MNLGAVRRCGLSAPMPAREEIDRLRRADSTPSGHRRLLFADPDQPDRDPALGGISWASSSSFASLVAAGGPVMIGLFVIGGINSVISLVYYLRVVKVMTVHPGAGQSRASFAGIHAGGVTRGGHAARRGVRPLLEPALGRNGRFGAVSLIGMRPKRLLIHDPGNRRHPQRLLASTAVRFPCT